MERQKKVAIVIFIIGIISLFRTVLLNWSTFLLDFSVYFEAAIRFLHHQNPYLIDTASHLQYLYPPFSLFFIFPFAFFSYEIASKLWILLSVLTFCLTLLILKKIEKLSLLNTSIIFTLTTFSFPFKFTIGMGQINLIIVFFLSLLILYIKNKEYTKSGIAFSILISLKLFPIFFALPLIMKKQWKIMLVSIGVLCALAMISLIYFGTDINSYYIHHVFIPLLSHSSGSIYYNQSFDGFLMRMGMNSTLSLIIRTIFLLITLYIFFKKKVSLEELLAVFITLILILNNISWQHHLVLLIIPFSFLINRLKGKKYNMILGCSYVLLALNIPQPSFFEHRWYGSIILSHGFIGMMLLYLFQIFFYAKKK